MKQKNIHAHNNRQINKRVTPFMRAMPSDWTGSRREWTILLGELLAKPIREREEV